MLKFVNNVSLVIKIIIFLKKIPDIKKNIKTVGCFSNKILPSILMFLFFIKKEKICSSGVDII